MQSKYDMISKVKDKETKMKIAKIYDDFESAKELGITINTKFLSPNMLSFILENFKNFININFCGGFQDAERVCVYFSVYEDTNIDYKIDILEIKYSKKYSKELKHSDVLGSIMALQITRDLIGDIIINEESIYIATYESITDFIIDNLKKIGRTNVKVSKVEILEDISIKEPLILHSTVASLRVDAVISKVFNLSRTQAKSLIEGGKVFINWINILDASSQICDNDIITLRGYGRIKFLEIKGVSKKDKIKILYQKY